MKYNVAVVGATGMVGRKMLQVLSERKLPIDQLYLFASAKSAGKEIDFMGKSYTVVELTEENIKSRKTDIALFSAGAGTSKTFAPIFAANAWNKGIIANPNCSTIQAVVALAPLHKKYHIKRVIYSTYQAVSGAGVMGYTDLEDGIKGLPPKKFPKPIFGNCLPHIDVFLDNGYTKE